MTPERDAAAAMVEGAWSALRDTPGPLTPVTVAIALRAGLRALAAHQHRTPSDLPAQSVVAWLRTVASELSAAGRADAAQDGARTALGAAGACGRAVGPDGAAAGAGEDVGTYDSRVQGMVQVIARDLNLQPRDFADADKLTVTVTGKQLRGLAGSLLWQADTTNPDRA